MDTKVTRNVPLVSETLLGDKVVSHVYESWDYDKFTTFKENREPDHVGRIASNMIEYGAIDKPIICTKHPDYPDKLVAVDGNNSRYARMQLHLPIIYVMLEDATPNEMTALNLVSRNWNNRNYIDFYASLGYTDYLIFQNMLKEYDDFTCRSMEYILRLSTTNDNSATRETSTHHSIARGLFKCKDTIRSREIIDFLLKVKNVEGDKAFIYKADKFVAAVVRLFNHKHFDPVRAIKKFKAAPFLIKKQADANGYLEMIEDIYNWHSTDREHFDIARFK